TCTGGYRSYQRIGLSELDPGIANIAQSLPGVLPQASLEHAANVQWRLSWKSIPVRLAFHDRSHGVPDIVTRKGAAACEHLVEHAAEGPDVRAFVHDLATRLLWRHVRRGAEDDPQPCSVNRQCWRHRRAGTGGGRGVEGLREAEVEQF